MTPREQDLVTALEELCAKQAQACAQLEKRLLASEAREQTWQRLFAASETREKRLLELLTNSAKTSADEATRYEKLAQQVALSLRNQAIIDKDYRLLVSELRASAT